MTDLHEPLEDMLAEIPSYVVPDARAAWTAGARRRTRHRLGVVAAVAVVVALLAGAVTWLPRTVEPQPADGQGVGGYPARVLEPGATRELPGAAGPMAMVYQRNGADASGWWVADARGRTWPAPQRDVIDSYPPALSPDGRMLAYLSNPTMYVIRDLSTGDSTNFDSITDGLDIREGQGEWVLGSQNPSFWSPDGSRVLVRASGWSPDSPTTALLLGVDGSLTELETDGFPAGWVDDDTLAFVVDGTSYRDRPPAELRLVSINGKVERTVTLDIPRYVAAWVNQWSASVSPDGSRVAVSDGSETGDVYELSTGDGSVLRHTQLIASDGCSPSWQGDEPVVIRTGSLIGVSGDVVTEFDSRLDAVCALAASDALTGDQHVGVAQRWFGDGWLAYNLPEALAFAIGGLVLVGVVLLVVRTNRRGRVHHLG